MPVHDWTRVDAGIFHAFAFGWASELVGRPNSKLPPGYYPLVAPTFFDPADPDYQATEPTETAYIRRQKRIAVRATAGHRLVAVIDLLEVGVKENQFWRETFTVLSNALHADGVHQLVIDLLPPATPPPGKPLTLAAYSAGLAVEAFIEPVAVGDALPDMPLFLTPDAHIPVPLEVSYAEAWAKIPSPWREVLEPPA